ncbi:MAG: cytochrome c-type biogenesis protein CcmH [Candidatus Marinimicrobia bacterium]|nr:cytochrome c-type biogenesis protein CcmH [Candidatus Neomarinimicrobiota bacterium]
MTRTLIALSVVSLMAGVLWAQGPKDALQRELEYEIMAPCCYGSPVGDHDSDAAKQVKAQIGQLIAEGKSREEIMDMYVAIYGERILASPRAQGFNIMAYVMPPLFLLLGGLLLVYAINQMKNSVPAPALTKRKSYSDEVFQKIEKEMQELNI